jgi:hypothetical protein
MTSTSHWSFDDFELNMMHSAQNESGSIPFLGGMDALVSSQGQTPAMMATASPQASSQQLQSEQPQQQLFVPPQQQLQRLVVVSQECLAKQEFHSSKQHEMLHVLVKNTPFNVELRLDNTGAMANQVVALNDVRIDVSLLYSHNDEIVPHPNGDAVTFEVPDSSAESMVLRTRIHALSSKHEKMNFRMRITLANRQTGVTLGDAYTAVTGAIKCVSKPDQALRCAVPVAPTTPSVARAQSERRRKQACVANDESDEYADDDDDVSEEGPKTKRGGAAGGGRNHKRARTVAAPGTAFLSGVGAAAAINALVQMVENQQREIKKLSEKMDTLLGMAVKAEC